MVQPDADSAHAADRVWIVRREETDGWHPNSIDRPGFSRRATAAERHQTMVNAFDELNVLPVGLGQKLGFASR